jgi:hypothetical protein
MYGFTSSNHVLSVGPSEQLNRHTLGIPVNVFNNLNKAMRSQSTETDKANNLAAAAGVLLRSSNSLDLTQVFAAMDPAVLEPFGQDKLAAELRKCKSRPDGWQPVMLSIFVGNTVAELQAILYKYRAVSGSNGAGTQQPAVANAMLS